MFIHNSFRAKSLFCFKLVLILFCLIVGFGKCYGQCDISSKLSFDNIGIEVYGEKDKCANSYSSLYEIKFDHNPDLESAIYTVHFSDGSEDQIFTVEDLKKVNGIINHVFTKSSCVVHEKLFSATVTATTCNSIVKSSASLTSVRVLEVAKADFSLPEKQCVNKDINIKNLTEPGYNYDCNKTFHSKWDFGDGTSSTENNPKHSYSQVGSYTVTLVVYVDEDLGCSFDTVRKAVQIIADPILNQIKDIEVCAGTKIDSIQLSGTNVAKVEWEYGSYVGLSNGTATKPLKIPSFIAKNGGSSILEKEIIVTPYNEAGCAGQPVKFKVKVKPSPEIKDIDDVTACHGETISQINFKSIVPNTTFTWKVVQGENVGLSQTSGNTDFVPAFTASSDGQLSTAKIEVTASSSDPNLAMCPGAKKEFEIKVTPAPIFNITVDSITRCGASDGKINLKGLAANTFYYVTIKGSERFLKSDANGTITISDLRAGTYSDIKVRIGKCDYTSPETVVLEAPTAPETPVITVESPTVCEGETLKFTAKAEEGVTYKWKGPGFWTSPEQNPERTNVRPSYSGTYQLYVVKNNCESATAEVDVVITAKPSVSIINLPTATNGVCGSYLFTRDNNLKIEEEEGIKNAEWTVEPTEGVTFTTSANDLSTGIQFSTFGTYNITLKYSTTCGEEEVKGVVKIDQPIQMSLTPVDPMCANIITEQNTNGVTLNATPEGGSWILPSHTEWVSGNTFYPNQPGEYYIKYSVKVASCTASDSMLVKVNEYPALDLGEDVSICEGYSETITLTAEPNDGIWSGDYITGTSFNPPSEVGTYIASYVVQDVSGCKSYGEKRVVVQAVPSPEFGPDFACLPNEAIFEPVADKSNQFYYEYGDGQKDNTGKHLYKNKGRYEVKMIVTAGNGCTDSLTKTIEVNESINAKFTLDTLKGCSPLPVTITPSYTEEDTLGSTFRWQLGPNKVYDGPFPEEQELTAKVFDSTYVIRLTVVNVCGTNIYEDSVTVYATAGADFEMETEWSCAPVEVKFQNKTQGTMEGVTYLWDFGDGETSTDRFPIHMFKGSLTDLTTYDVRLVTYNKCGADSIQKTLYVKPQNIKAQFDNKIKLGCTDTEICFSNNSVGMSGEEPISQVSWDFGNGEYSNEWNGCTQFNKPGTYQVKLVISNACSKDEYQSEIEIFEKPKVKIESPKSVCIGDSLFPKFSTDATVKGVNWNFGDGGTSSFISPSHIYTEPNQYVLSLVIIANNAGECRTSDSIEVIVPETPIPEVTPLEFSGCSPLRYEPEFDMQYYYTIDYEDNDNWTSVMSHDYVNTTYEPVYYTVNIVAENIYGCKAKQRGIVAVYPQPTAGIKKTVEEGRPEIVTFHNVSERYDDCYWTLPFSGVQNTCDSVKEEFFSNEEQIVSLHVENKYRCYDDDTITHKPLMKGLYFPNTFIPGSNNKNINTFNGVGIGISEYLLEIFDLYGNLIFSTTSLDKNGTPNQGWDGTDSHGKLMPQDAYTWRARAIFEDGSVYPYGNSHKGKETLQRGTVLLLIK